MRHDQREHLLAADLVRHRRDRDGMRAGSEARRREIRFSFDFGESRPAMENLTTKMATHFSRLQKPVLVLNASYEPINICAARRALVLVLKGVAAA